MYAQEETLCRRTSALQDLFHWKSIEWRGRNFRPKTDSQPLSLSLSLSVLLGNRTLLWNSELHQQKLAAFNTWPSLNIEPTLNQHLVKSLMKVWSYAEGTSTSKAIRNRNRLLSSVKQHRANKQRASPRVTQRHDTRGFQHPGNERQISIIST